jgi:DNA polymerase-3 subunit alpha
MTDEPSCVHLHVHSEYSLLDGAARIEAPKFHPDAQTIFTEAARHGMSAVSVTDHGAMFGALRFFEAGRAAGIKPIIGVEAYVAPGSRFERNPGENEEKYHHLTLLAENETGYRNLLKLVSAAYLEGFYHRPRMDKELLADHAEGVICLSGCLSSELSTMLLAGQDRRAEEAAGRYRDIFGPDRFFMELQDHGIPDQRRVLPKQVALARSLGIPLVATNDLHYTVKEDAKPHDVLLCIQQQKLQSDPKRLKFDSEEFYLKSPQEMRRVFHELPEACDNTLLIAERAELDLVYGDRAPVEQRFHLPRFETPDGKDLEGYLRASYAGPGTYLPHRRHPRAHRRRARRHHPDVCGVPDRVDLDPFARESGIHVGRAGSAAGSVVSYHPITTRIRCGTIDLRTVPNPARRSMPDIDTDFDERRARGIRYARSGTAHHVAIITFRTIKGRGHPARRACWIPTGRRRPALQDVPATAGPISPIETRSSPEFREAYEKEPEAKEIVDTARALEGLRREDSVHAAGVVIGDAPLVNYLPLKLSKDSRDDSKRVVTQFDMVGVEALGLLKMDF